VHVNYYIINITYSNVIPKFLSRCYIMLYVIYYKSYLHPLFLNLHCVLLHIPVCNKRVHKLWTHL